MGRRQDRQVWRGQSFELVLLRLSLGRENIFACIILTFLYDQSEAIRNLTWRYIVCQLICFALLLHFCTYQADTIRQWFCLGFVHVSPPNSFKPERVVFTCIKSWKKSSVHIRWLGSSKATSGGDRWRTGTVLSSGSDPARRRPQCACNRFTWYFLHTFHLTNQRSNCVTQLKLDTGEKLSSPIFCCLCVCEASVSPDQMSTFSNIYRHTSPMLTQYNI